MFQGKIDEAREEIIECDPYISTILAEAGAIAGMAIGKEKITPQQYEEKMEVIKKVSSEFQNKCSCKTKQM
jgi:hypothetical protein